MLKGKTPQPLFSVIEALLVEGLDLLNPHRSRAVPALQRQRQWRMPGRKPNHHVVLAQLATIIPKSCGLFRSANASDAGLRRVSPRPEPSKKGYRSPFGVTLPGHSEHMMTWVYQPEKAPVARTEKPRRGEHPLTRIAEQLSLMQPVIKTHEETIRL